MKIIVVHDEGFEPAALSMIQDANIQPAWVYGGGPWIVSDQPLSQEQVERALKGEEV